MPRWVILFRGINVGGHRKVAMAELRAQMGAAGFADVRSYIQSGNVVADFDGDRAQVSACIRDIVARAFGFDADLLVLSPDDLNDALAGNPFATVADDPSRMHLFFHMNPAEPTAIADLTADDAARAGEGALAHYLWTPEGMSKSTLADKVSRRLAGKATARNLRTCEKLVQMAQS